ncbi:hypothetical protein LCGC14_2949840, partial [marine sediment metagenome]
WVHWPRWQEWQACYATRIHDQIAKEWGTGKSETATRKEGGHRDLTNYDTLNEGLPDAEKIKQCPRCGGSGIFHSPNFRASCNRCKGSGHVLAIEPRGPAA